MTDFVWDDYLHLAQRLAPEQDEAARRTAISRAYYFMYHLARQRALDNNCSLPSGGDAHKRMWECYTNSPDPTCKRLGIEGHRLKERRNVADYDLPFRGRLDDEVKDVLEKATKFSEQLRKLDPRQPRGSN